MINRLALLALNCLALAATAAPLELRWRAEASNPQPYAATIYQGETITLAATLTAYNAPIELADGSTCTLYYQTNGMAATWWEASGTIADSTLRATWTPAQDIGAPLYTFFLAATTPGGRLYRAHGILSMRASPGFTPAVLPPPDVYPDFAGALWPYLAPLSAAAWGPRLDLIEQRTNAWDSAYSWGNHVGLYLALPDWRTWLATNALATTTYVDQAISAIPPPLTDRIINERQMLDADLDVWDVRDVGDTNVLILAYGYNYAPGAPPVPIDTRYTLGSMQIGGVTVPAYISNDPDYHAIYRQGADWYLDLPGAGAQKLTPRAPGYGEAFQFQYGGYELFNGVIPAFLMFARPRRPPLMVDRLALASELDGGDYVPRQGGTATNLTLFGWVAMPQSQPTNLFLRLTASNEFILVEEVLQ